jgi:two-component system sensor histidine kinase HydH
MRPSPGGPRRGPALLVVELEPPVIAQLRTHLTSIAIVAAAAAAVLVAFAVALSRSARRLAAIEQRAAREQRLVALGSMSSVMAHELRNPLASLKGHAQLLAEDLEDDKQRKKAERVVNEAQRLEELTTSLLDFVRDGPIERVDIDAKDLVARALEHLPADRVDVTTRGETSMTVDAARLCRAVHNLVDNAIKASPDGARVELAVDGRDGAIEIVVRDHGPGIADPAQIFEPFVTTRVRGTGLGLPVARRIAEQHGGTLNAENHPDGGARFTLRIPRHRAS